MPSASQAGSIMSLVWFMKGAPAVALLSRRELCNVASVTPEGS